MQGMRPDWLRIRQLILIDPSGEKPAYKRLVDPARWLAGLLVSAGLLVGMGYWLGATRDDRASQMIAQLKKEMAELSDLLAEARAEAELARGAQTAMEQTLAKEKARADRLQRRVLLFESILSERSKPGVHLLAGQAHWAGEQAIQVELVLVKGGNYPRTATGSIHFQATDPEGNAVELLPEGATDPLRYRLQSHTFVQTTLIWRQDWRPRELSVVLTSPSGRELARENLSIGSES